MNYIWQKLEFVGTLKPIALFSLLFFSYASAAAWNPQAMSAPGFDLRKITIKVIEERTGKKLTVFQKIQLKVLLKAIPKSGRGNITEQQKNQATISMILGIISILLLPLSLTSIGIIALLSMPAALIAIIFGKKSRKGNSNKAGLIGIITGAISLSIVIAFSIIVLTGFAGGIK